MTIHSDNFGVFSDGRTATRFTLRRASGLECALTDYGATLISLLVPDRRGARVNVLPGYDSLEEYQRQTHYFGGLVGRFANRIAHGRFMLEGSLYQLTVNNGENHLHGGAQGFDRRLWRVAATSDDSVTLEYASEDGEEGYPGALTATVTYTLSDAALRIELSATCEQPTIVNLTSHSYFNLAGGGTILEHQLTIPADLYTPVAETLIPTGELRTVAGSPFDFRQPTPIGARLHEAHPQLQYGKGYDHNWVIKTAHNADLTLAARLYDPASGRVLEIHSTQPGLQVYSGNYFTGADVLSGGREMPQYGAVALEPHNFPDAPNQPHFPSAIITPDEPYRQLIEYRFGVE